MSKSTESSKKKSRSRSGSKEKKKCEEEPSGNSCGTTVLNGDPEPPKEESSVRTGSIASK
jgi:hypothetical protein